MMTQQEMISKQINNMQVDQQQSDIKPLMKQQLQIQQQQ
jgi:hypothetical protein